MRWRPVPICPRSRVQALSPVRSIPGQLLSSVSLPPPLSRFGRIQVCADVVVTLHTVVETELDFRTANNSLVLSGANAARSLVKRLWITAPLLARFAGTGPHAPRKPITSPITPRPTQKYASIDSDASNQKHVPTLDKTAISLA